MPEKTDTASEASGQAEFPAELLGRCAGAIMRNYTRENKFPPVVFSCDIEAVLRESGHAELVAALKLVLEWIGNWDPNFIYDDEWPDDRSKIDAALRRAGAL